MQNKLNVSFLVFVIGVLICLCLAASIVLLSEIDDFFCLNADDVDVGPVHEPLGLISGEAGYLQILFLFVVLLIFGFVLFLMINRLCFI